MRSNQNLDGSTDVRVATKLNISMPLEWLDAGSWRLPSGKALAEFALQAGFLAPLLLRSEQFKEQTRGSVSSAMRVRTKDFGKGESR